MSEKDEKGDDDGREERVDGADEAPTPEEKPPSSSETPSGSTKRASSKPPSSSLPTPLDTVSTSASSWGWGYPAFARDFPRHPELDALVEAFARGDYRTVRERAPKLASDASDAKVKRAAETLRQRIEPDSSSKVLFLFAGLLLAFLTVWWVAHDGPSTDEKAAPTKSRALSTH